MSLFMEIETDRKLPFDARKIAELVIETSLDYVKCPYETEVIIETSNSSGVNNTTSAPFSFAPSSTAFAMASVFPVPLQ